MDNTNAGDRVPLLPSDHTGEEACDLHPHPEPPEVACEEEALQRRSEFNDRLETDLYPALNDVVTQKLPIEQTANTSNSHDQVVPNTDAALAEGHSRTTCDNVRVMQDEDTSDDDEVLAGIRGQNIYAECEENSNVFRSGQAVYEARFPDSSAAGTGVPCSTVGEEIEEGQEHIEYLMPTRNRKQRVPFNRNRSVVDSCGQEVTTIPNTPAESVVNCLEHPENCPLVTGTGSLALDGGWGWLVVLGALLCNVLLTAMSRTFGVFYPYIQLEFGTSVAVTTAISSVSNSVRLFGGPLASQLCDWLGCRLLVVVGGLMWAVGYGASCVAPNIYYLYVTLGLLTGVGGALIYTPIHITVNEYFNRKRGLALAGATVGLGIGTFAMAPLQLILLHTYGYAGMTFIMGALMLNFLVGGALMRPVESNHAAHRVALARALKQQTRNAHKEFRLKKASERGLFYEKEIIPAAGGVTASPSLTARVTSAPRPTGTESSVLSVCNTSRSVPSLYPKLDTTSQDTVQPHITSSVPGASDYGKHRNYGSIDCNTQYDIAGGETFNTDENKNERNKNPTYYEYSKNYQDLKYNSDLDMKEKSSDLDKVEHSKTDHDRFAVLKRKLSLFSRAAMVLYCLQCMVLQFVTSAPLTFLPQLGVELGASDTLSSLLISVSGLADIVGRFLFGFLFDTAVVRPYRRLLHGGLGLVLGTATLSLAFTADFGSLLLGSAAHGLVAGAFHAQKTAVLAEFLPLVLLSDAVGFSFFFEGIGSLIATPLFGVLVDEYNTYKIGYIGCGGIFLFFTVLVLIEYCIYKLCRRRRHQKV